MNNYYHRSQFLTSASQSSEFPEASGYEVAFAGRSNAGKSSALNALCQNKALARTSKTPGRTQLINFFTLDEQRRLVDLPGYGYARVPEKMRLQWQKLMEGYLGQRTNLCGLVIIMDIRHPMKDYDIQMLDLCQHIGIPCHIVLTKADKLKRGPALQVRQNIINQCKQEGFNSSVQIFSALKNTGLEELQSALDNWFELGEAEAEA